MADHVLVVDIPRLHGGETPLDEWQMGFANRIAMELDKRSLVKILGARLEVQSGANALPPDPQFVWVDLIMGDDAKYAYGVSRNAIDEAVFDVAFFIAARLYLHIKPKVFKNLYGGVNV